MNKNDVKPRNELTKGKTIFVKKIIDDRDLTSNVITNQSYKKVRYYNDYKCVNVAKLYKSNFIDLLSLFGSKYIYTNSSLKTTTNPNLDYDYILDWKLNTYRVVQDFSKEAKKAKVTETGLVIAFGLIGYSLADATNEKYYYSNGDIKISFEYIRLLNKDGVLINDLSNLTYQYNDSLIADGYCGCAYYNADLHFKFAMKNIAHQIDSLVLADLSK